MPKSIDPVAMATTDEAILQRPPKPNVGSSGAIPRPDSSVGHIPTFSFNPSPFGGEILAAGQKEASTREFRKQDSPYYSVTPRTDTIVPSRPDGRKSPLRT
ncbi:hypothetical protein NL676_009076 [Syzygium grande]|nr:hypothetical protein NL676_009076 [Syzygium grande]